MNINRECERIFLDYEDVSKDWIRIGHAISQLSACVQNPDFMCPQDLEIFNDNCKMVSENMNETITNTKKELNELYKRVLEVYKLKLGE